MIVSSHEFEEEKILSSLNNIIHEKKIKVCIAPRHPSRANEISKILNKYKLSYSFDSKYDNYDNDVIIIDSFGNLDKYYYKSEIIILGGSFISKGGHNPLEPAKYGCALITGNLVYNWQNIYDEMVKEKACIMINNVNNLNNIIDELMLNKSLIEDYKQKALDFSNRDFFDNETLFKEINMVLI